MQSHLDTTTEAGSGHRIPPRGRRFLGISLALLLATGTFFTGLQIGQFSVTSTERASGGAWLQLFASDASVSTGDAVDLREFWRVWEILDNKFSRTGTTTLSAEDKLRGAIAGLVEAYGDPYTVYLPPADTKALTEDISGNFSGVGMEVGIRNDVVTVIAPLPETPATRAGIVAGDVIAAIDGQSTEGMRVDEAVRLIRGEKGTSVTLQIYRTGEPELRTITVVRDTIAVPTVATERRGDTFVVKLYSFNALSEAKMQEALRDFVRSDATSLVLDLRGNPGGLLQSAVSIASFFLPTGKVVVREDFGQSGREEIYRSQGRVIGDFSNKKLVVLVDGGSASASEILAGALQDHDLATVLGVQTFGKGSVQELVELPTGASVKVTVARWLTPEGTSISEGGLAPDIVIKRTPQQYLDGVDPQLDAALRFLSGEEVLSESATTTPALQ